MSGGLPGHLNCDGTGFADLQKMAVIHCEFEARMAER